MDKNNRTIFANTKEPFILGSRVEPFNIGFTLNKKTVGNVGGLSYASENIESELTPKVRLLYLYYSKNDLEILSNINNVNIVLSGKIFDDQKLKKEAGTITFISTVIENFNKQNIVFSTQVSVVLNSGVKFSFNYIRTNYDKITSTPSYSNIPIRKITRIIMGEDKILRKLIIKQ